MSMNYERCNECSPVRAYSSRLSDVTGGMEKLYGESLERWRSLNSVLRNQCLITFTGRHVRADISAISSSPGEQFRLKCARSTRRCSSVMRVRDRFSSSALDTSGADADVPCCCC